MSVNDNDGLAARSNHGTDAPRPEEDRRTFLSTVAMYTGLLSAYGFLATLAGRFLFPSRPAPKAWLFVTDLASVATGDSLSYQTPSGHKVAITRTGEAGVAADFIALSSTCPHLGCQVHWESQNTRFFCPCHNGAFDMQGAPTEGPPKDSNQSLARYPLKVENGLLFIEVATGGSVA